MVLAVASLVSTLFAEVRTVGDTVAYFNDQEVSVENKLQAASLFISLSAGDDYAADYEFGHFGDEEYYLNVDLGGTLPSTYVVSGVLDPTNPAGCDQLLIDATFTDFTYSGPFTSFTSTPTTQMGEWEFELSLPTTGGPAAYSECKGEIVFTANVADVDESLKNTYSDTAIYTFEIIAEPTLDEPMPIVEGVSDESNFVAPPTEPPAEAPADEPTEPSEPPADQAIPPSSEGGQGGSLPPAEPVDEPVVEEEQPTEPEPIVEPEPEPVIETPSEPTPEPSAPAPTE